MKKMFCVLTCFCATMTTVWATSSTHVKGVVKDGDANVISKATVCLNSDTTKKISTDEKGEFLIETHSSINTNQLLTSQFERTITLSMKNNLLGFYSNTPIQTGTISLFSVNGRRHFAHSFISLQKGLHTFSTPKLPAGCYLLMITIENSVLKEKIFFNENLHLLHTISSDNKNMFHTRKTASVATVDTILVVKTGFKPEKYPIVTYNQTGLVIIMDRTTSPSISVKDLPVIKEMPDPMTMKDGTKVTTEEQWRLRRREMIRILEDFEYGHMPPPPGNVKTKVKTATKRITVGGKPADYKMLHLTFGPGDKCGFDLGMFTPVSSGTNTRYPVLISVDFSASQSSIGASSAAFSRGYAVVTIPYNQLGADAKNWKSTAFFPSYPEYDWRDISAWAWGVSRAVDYLVTDSLIDKDKIMITGTSRCGQAVLLAGAFDERIALSAPVAGGMAFRFSGKEMGNGLGQGITEIVDQNTYWFGPLLEKFRNQTPRLPCDQHWLPSLTAPRLFMMCNSLKDEYGRAYAAVQTYLGAKPVYEFLKFEENIGVNFRSGGHGMNSEDWSALLDFADQKLLKKTGTRKFNIIPPESQTP
ncbi:MAG: hypothetical protein JW915_00370 [Chitinispirillaceae bacterium]|nr:hypothetical protein [Chitinispirillaceae bacterium]